MAMLLRFALGEVKAADAIEAAVLNVIAAGYRTGDLARGYEGEKRVNTKEMGAAIVAAL